MARVLTVLGFLALVLVANWPYAYQVVLFEAFGTGVELITIEGGSARPSPPTLAGWPFKFYLCAGETSDSRVASFKWTALLLNVCFWSLIPLVYVAYEKFFFRRTRRSDALEIEGQDWADVKATEESKTNEETLTTKHPQKPKRRTLQLADIFVVTAIIASAFGFWQLLRKRGELDKKLAAEISSLGGGAIRTAILPSIPRELFRIAGYSACLRTSEVRLVNPDDALLAKVVALPYLRTLSIAGGNYDFKTLNRLATNPLLAELAIVGRPLNADAIFAIRSLPALRKLNLMRTNITAAGLAAIEQPRLTDLNLIHTDVRLSELGTPAFAKTMRNLSLPHPSKGAGDSLRIEDWPQLASLSCYEYDELLNREPVAITLKNLPSLSTLELDGLQMFDIDFEQLPSLFKLETNFLQWEKRTTPKQIVPSFLWAGKLRMKGVPMLKELSIFAADTKLIDIDQETMKLGLCVFNKGAGRDGSISIPGIVIGAGRDYSEPGYLTHSEIPLPTRQKWVDDLAKCKGLESADLELVPLKGVKLNSLAANKSIRQLMLGKSGLVGSQLSELKGMDQLESLSLIGVRLDGRTIEWLTKTFPNLRQIFCDGNSVQRLRIEQVPNLESIFELPVSPIQPSTSQFAYVYATPMDALRIVDAPKLRDQFVLASQMLLLHIESAPSLKGLSFQEPLPDNAVLRGVRDLKFFAAGGATCTDAIVNEVLNCKGLQRLTLAYTKLSPETFKRIVELRELEYLALTGSNIESQFVESLASLDRLRTLRLDETSIERGSIAPITKLKDLEVLDLGGLHLTSDGVTQLASSLPKLKELTLVGAELTVDSMRQIAKLSSLQLLDLSKCELNDEMLNTFAESPPPQLVKMKLNSAKIGEAGFNNFVRKARNSRFTLKDTDVNPQILDTLVAQNRATLTEWEPYGGGYDPRLSVKFACDIDPHRFAPNYKDPRIEYEETMNSQAGFGSVQMMNDGLDDGLGAMSAAPLGPPMTPLETLGYQLFKILSGQR